MGMATTRVEERVAAGMGKGSAKIWFDNHQALHQAGVLFLIPALLSQGLLKTKSFYQFPSSHYYQLESIVLTLAVMALCRIKNPEQIKQCKVGDLGRLMGLDRIPEVKCLRNKLHLISETRHARDLNNTLIDHWYNDQDSAQQAAFLYLDGHMRLYHGHQGNVPAKFISRQKLCLSATAEFWVHDQVGMPLMVVIGQLNEKLKEMIGEQIIPQLKETRLLAEENTPLLAKENTPDQPRCTLIFDREAYEPDFFYKLWEEERIAVITYRKNVTDNWEEKSFKKVLIDTVEPPITMHLCEREVTLAGHRFREIRKRSQNHHQTAIITTHPCLDAQTIALKMFSRWQQENFFKYMLADYNFDAITTYGVEPIDGQKEVVNPAYRKLTALLKKKREKRSRLEAGLYPIVEQIMDQSIDHIPELTKKQCLIKAQIMTYKQEIDQLIEKRKGVKRKITLQEMPQKQRYNKLKTESKMFMNIIKMICYRAESAMANLLPGTLKGEQRMCLKQMIQNNADVIADYQKNTLTVTLHAMTARRYNQAIGQLCETLNQTQTIFPGTPLTMIFKTTEMAAQN